MPKDGTVHELTSNVGITQTAGEAHARPPARALGCNSGNPGRPGAPGLHEPLVVRG